MAERFESGAAWRLGADLPTWLSHLPHAHLNEPVDVLQAHSLDEVLPLVRRVWQASLDGAWCCGFIAYEAAAAFDQSLTTCASSPGEAASLPLACFFISEQPPRSGLPASGRFDFTQPWLMDDAVVSDCARNRIETVREAIGAGRYYQLNLTAGMTASGDGDPHALFDAMARLQPAMLGFCLHTPAWAVVSASPELFFQWDGELIQTRPMKGTAAPSGDTTADVNRLRASDKDRAENVMIVDLLRNDLSRIAQPGTVSVPALFDVQTHPTVVQMTSTVQARTRPGCSLEDVFKALFPCGSVTGAPKHESMRHLTELEGQPRGVYCGTVGLLAPGGKAFFNVAIRTLTHQRQSARLRYGVGSGLTWYSNPAAEWDEWQWKTRIAHRSAAAFSILETVGLRDGVWQRRQAHLARMEKAAQAFGYVFERDCIDTILHQTAAGHAAGEWRGRWLLQSDGQFSIEVHRLDELALPLTLQLAESPIDQRPGELPFVQHKTTWRVPYERHRSRLPDGPDVLMRSTCGQVLETARGNLVMDDGHGLWTPDSLWQLSGVLQAELLAAGNVRARRIGLDDLLKARSVWVVNSLRGWMPVSCVVSHQGEAVARFEPVFRVSSAL